MTLPQLLGRLFRGIAASVLGLVAPVATATTAHNVQWTATAPGALPAEDAVWVPVALPARWTAADAAPLHGAVLRLTFDLPESPQRQIGVLLTRLSPGGRVRVNGHRIVDIPTDDGRREAMWRRPFLLPLAAPVLVGGRNVLTIEFAYGNRAHRVGTIAVAPVEELTRAYEVRYFFTNTVPWIGAMLAASIVLFFGSLLLRWPDRLLSLLAVASLLWLAYNGILLLEVQPALLHPALNALAAAGLGSFMTVIATTLMRLSDRRLPREEALAWIYTAAGPVLLLLTQETTEAEAAGLWLLGLAAIVALALLYGGIRRLRADNAPGVALLLAAGLLVLAALHDGLLTLGTAVATDVPLLPVAGPLVLVALATPLVDRFFRALKDAETARTELESRVREREQLLKRNFERLRDSERAQARHQERQRIMQDIHDGLGSQLLSALMLVERRALNNRQVAQVLRESIDDLRLAIDAIASDEATLAGALGNLRFRLEPRLRAAGIALAWDARSLPSDLELDPGVVLPILRVVQEALTNALKHSRATHIRVDLKVEGDGGERALVVRVADDGRGILDEGVRGRGLLNMRSRAAKIGATFSLHSAPDAGTSIVLRLGLAPPAAPAAGNGPASITTEIVLAQALRR